MTFTFYDHNQLVEISLCGLCRHALDVAAMVHEGIIGEPYEIVDVQPR